MWIKRQGDFSGAEYLPAFVKRFDLIGKIKSCKLKITATGIFTVKFNGKKTGDYFMPGWSNYKKYVNECEYDLTDGVKENNEISVIVADGWYAGNLGYNVGNAVYGKEKRLRAEIAIEYENAEKQTIETDETWDTYSSNIVRADFFDGEAIDFTHEEFANGQKAEVCDFDLKREPYLYEPVRVIEKIIPEIIYRDENRIRLDFKKNFAGVISFTAKGARGGKVIVRFAETLNADGTLYTENLRRAKCTDELILSGGYDVFDPEFTFHGFRYAEISSDSEFTATDIIGKELSQNINYGGRFECSDDIINGVYKMASNGQKSNFISLPTDCPQRDERLGWTGDAEVFCNSAMFNADCEKFFANYLKLIRTDVLPDGRIPSFAPFFVPVADNTAGVPGWGDAITVIPYFHYLHYKDGRIITDNLPYADKWIGYYLAKSENYLTKITNNFGDWLSVDGKTDVDVINQCFFGYSVKIVAKMHAIIGDNAGETLYNGIYEKAREAFRKAYFDGERVKSDTQTAYAFAYSAGYITDKEARERLKAVIAANGNKLTTGFIGCRFLLPALCDMGESELAYEIITQTEYPSWGYMLENGATTVWERWNGYTKENGFENPEMNSFNHYSLGSCVEWLYSYVLGIKLSADKPVCIKPTFFEKLKYAKGCYAGKNGNIYIKIENKNSAVAVEITADDGAEYTYDFSDREILSAERRGKTEIITLKK